MKKKLALNVFYNLVLILSIWGIVWAYRNDSLLISAFLAGVFVTVLYFNIQLIKEVRKGH